ncbi:MAG: DUF3347 domain-containing protein, partial [Sedimentisphaerales bacterium]
LQIQAKPSMMSAKGGKVVARPQPGEHEHKHEIFGVPDEFRTQLWAVVQRYLSLKDALAGDDKDAAVKAAGQMLEVLSEVDMSLVSGEAHNTWMSNSTKMKASLDEITEADGIEAARKAFEKLSSELIAVAVQFEIHKTQTLYRFHCPMAFDNRGADWLQMDKDTRNPYFGATMLKCGEIVEVIGRKTK